MVISKHLKSKLNGLDNNVFIWLDEITCTKKQRLQINGRKYYKGFKLNSLTIFEGDCVHINVGSAFGDLVPKFEIARILECFYEAQENAKGFVRLQWYTQVSDIKKKHYKNIPASVPPLDEHLDVVRDMLSYETCVDVETISGHCCVTEVNAMHPPDSIQKPSDINGPLYVCRFIYTKERPWLLPLTDGDIIKTRTSVSTLKEVTNSPKRWNVCLVNVKESSSPELNTKQFPNFSAIHSAGKLTREEKINDSPKKKSAKRKLLDPDEDHENVFKKSRIQSSSPVIKKVEKMDFSHCTTKEKMGEWKMSSKTIHNRNNKIEVKTIVQFRGLQSTEISDLLSDEDNNFEENIKRSIFHEGKKKNRSSKSAGTVTPHADDQKEKLQNRESEKEICLSSRRRSKPTEKLKNYSQISGMGTTKSLLEEQYKLLEGEEVGESSSQKCNRLKEKTKAALEDTNICQLKRLPKENQLEKSILLKSKSGSKNLLENGEGAALIYSPIRGAKSGRKHADKSPNQTPRASKKLSPSMKLPERKTPLGKCRTEFEQARAQLHVSAVPSFLPCREDEFQQIYSFVEGKLLDSTGGCMYVSGVPGTGKTATVREVVRLLQECEQEGTVPSFHFLEVNAMKLTKPHQLWVQIWEGLTGHRVTADHAYSLFEKSLASSGPKRKSVYLLLDELDLLWTRKQDVMYNLFDLSSRVDSRLIVVTIANTMDLPERMMISRVSSRLGLTRMTFQPYTFKQLEEIIASRLMGIKAFDPDAIQLVARKVAAISGDARRALDVCRRATELAEQKKMQLLSSPVKSPPKLKVLVGMLHVSEAIDEMFSSPKIKAIRSCSEMERYILQAILMEFTRTGIEEAVLNRIFEHLQSICRLEGVCPPSSSETLKSINNLSSQKILLTEHSRLDLLLRIRLNISSDDVSYALNA